jgi:hypothetical protein
LIATIDRILSHFVVGNEGRMYYRLGMNYVPESLTLKAAQYGFKVTRRYEGVDKPEHAKQDSDGVWHFKLGEKVRKKKNNKSIH